MHNDCATSVALQHSLYEHKVATTDGHGPVRKCSCGCLSWLLYSAVSEGELTALDSNLTKNIDLCNVDAQGSIRQCDQSWLRGKRGKDRCPGLAVDPYLREWARTSQT